jgi:hypothetical protein
LVKNSFFLVNSFGFAAIFIHGIYIYILPSGYLT